MKLTFEKILHPFFVGLLLAATSYAAGTVTVTRSTRSYSQGGASVPYVGVIQIDWVADAANGSVPNTNIPISGYVTKVITNPGSTAPTALYDIAFGDPEDTALDALAGAVGNRSAATTEQVYPAIAGAPGTVTAVAPFLQGTYRFQLTNNSVNSATGRVLLYVTD